MALVQITCPACNHLFLIDDAQHYEHISCPTCGAGLKLGAGNVVALVSAPMAAGAIPTASPTPGAAVSPPTPMAGPVYPQAAAAPGAGMNTMLDFVKTQAYRAFAIDMRYVTPTQSEQAALAAQGITDPTVAQHLVWRRSLLALLLVPAAFIAISRTISTFLEKLGNMNGFGAMMATLLTLLYFGMPVTAALAFFAWPKLKQARWILLWGLLASFAIPMFFMIFPTRWWGDNVEGANSILQAMFFPLFLSIVPGMMRSAARTKGLLPQSMLSGWFLVIAAVCQAVIILGIFVFAIQGSAQFLLIFGVILLTGAPLVYAFQAQSFVRPLATDEELAGMRLARLIYIGATSLGIFAVSIFFLVFDSGETFVSKFWELTKFLFDIWARVLFLTAFGTDVILALTLSNWTATRQLQSMPQATELDMKAAAFDQAMTKA